ncbi:glycosyltransferase [Pseudarthrobacter siccitolerans]
MRILHIATLVTPDGAYGGPVRVALNQCKALAADGHDVIFAAGARGFKGPLPTSLDGVPVRLFPARQTLPGAGFAGLSCPGLFMWLLAEVAKADVCHVHLARDFVTLPAAWAAKTRGVPYVLQTHGMIDPSDHPLSKPLDAGLTRSILRRAGRLFFLTPEERTALQSVAGKIDNLTELPNGTPNVPEASVRTDRDGLEVLYLARLQARKRPVMFVQMAKELLHEFPDVRFRLVGPDEGEAKSVVAAIEAAGHEDSIQWEGPLSPDQTLERLKQAAVYVLPSVNEPFPMSVLEAMSVALPVVVSRSCGLAPAVARAEAGEVFDESLEGLIEAVRGLLGDPAKRRAAAANAKECSSTSFSMASIRQQLVTHYTEVVSGSR